MARAPSMRSTASVDLSGPFFQKDPGKTVLENIKDMMQGLAQEGERAAREGLMTGAGGRALVRGTGDRVADHVVGRVSALSGKDWTAAAVVSVNPDRLSARSAISLMAAASYVERRTRAIGRVSRQIRAERANLTAGIE